MLDKELIEGEFASGNPHTEGLLLSSAHFRLEFSTTQASLGHSPVSFNLVCSNFRQVHKNFLVIGWFSANMVMPFIGGDYLVYYDLMFDSLLVLLELMLFLIPYSYGW